MRTRAPSGTLAAQAVRSRDHEAKVELAQAQLKAKIEGLAELEEGPDGEQWRDQRSRDLPRAGPLKKVRSLEYDMRDFFRYCVALYAELTGTSPGAHPRVPTPLGPLAWSLQGGLGGPEGREVEPAE